MSMSIHTKSGVVFIIDDEDIDLSLVKWYLSKRQYAARDEYTNRVRTSKYLHRVILERIIGRKLLDDEVCDHIDGNTTDNRRCNLRVATRSDNVSNCKKPITNTSGFIGVSWSAVSMKWRSYSKEYGGGQVHLGLFDTPEEAARARDAWVIKNRNGFYRLNFPESAQLGAISGALVALGQ